ncbi:MAG: DUF4340 domain-containing protein [Rhodanobacteraceae bacterium]|nr:DUF4340 domain-containing protein [Rhodanobacteraceae bacterium]
MNSKTVIGLGAAAVLAVAIAATISISRKPVAETAQGAAELLPGLGERINDIKRISVTGAGQKRLVTLDRTEQGWVLAEKGGYPADAGKVREYLLKLGQSRLVEQKTANEQRYADIGVTDIGAADAKGMLVALDGLPQPAQLIVGIVNTRGDSTYVRRAGEAQSWLAKGSLVPDKTAANWLDKLVVDLPATRVREVVWTRPDGKPVRILKDKAEDTNYRLADLPKGRELASDYVTNTQATTLAGLNFDDVLPAAEAAPPADGKVYRATFASFDGIVVEMTGWKKGDLFHAQFKTHKDQSAFDASVAAVQNETKTEVSAPAGADGSQPVPAAVDPAKDKAERAAKLDAEVGMLAKRVEGWTFVLPAYKAANFDKGSEEFLKPLGEKSNEAKKTANAK